MNKNTQRFAAAAAAAFALVAGSAHAQTPASDTAAPAGSMQGMQGMHGHMMGHGGPGMHRPGMGGEHFGLALKKLHDKLHLSADQQKQWQAALDAQKQSRETARANHQAFRKQIDALRQQPILDLNALHAAREHLMQQDQQAREQATSAWLAFYNGLNDAQKTTVSDALKARFAKMEARREKMREHWQHKDHGMAPASSAAAQ